MQQFAMILRAYSKCKRFLFLLADIDDCLSNPCQNGGQCTDLVNGFACICISGFSGEICQFRKYNFVHIKKQNKTKQKHLKKRDKTKTKI